MLNLKICEFDMIVCGDRQEMNLVGCSRMVRVRDKDLTLLTSSTRGATMDILAIR